VFPVEPIPERIGAYRVLRRLTAPGPAETFLGRASGPRGFSREVVLKRMKNTIEGNERLAEELTREAAICSRINHPAILRMVDFFEDAGHLVLALEHIDGTALDQLLDHLAEHHQKLGDAAAFYIGHRIAGALAYAHAATDDQGVPTPIIHRNLHPSNVVIGADGDVRLTGFGVGKILGRTPDTAIGTIKGTPGYMAPEQARGEPVTAKADTYGMGLLLWSLLSGKKPPQDGTWPAKISTLRKDLPREIAAVIDASLDRFPGTRRITCGEIERWLGKVASDEKGRRELKEQMLTLADELSTDDIEVEPEAATLPPVAPAAPAPPPANPFQGVRFGPPAPIDVTINATPAAAAPKARGDWRQSLPDVESLDDLIDSVRSPDRSRLSEPTLPQSRVYPPAPPLPAPAAAPKLTPAPPVVITPVIAPEPRVTPPPPAARVTPVSVVMAATSPKVAAQPAAAALVILGPSVAAAPAPTPPPEAAVTAPVFGSPPVFSPGPPPVATTTTRALPEGVPPPPRPRAPSPSLLAETRRTLGTGGTIGVSALTATVVVVAAFVLRDRPPPPTIPSSVETTAPTVIPAPPASAIATAAPSAVASAAPPSTANLPAGFGLLTVASPAVAHVYISGKRLGPANEPLEVRCGRWFVRLAAPREGRYPEWVSRGETVDVGCQVATRIEILPAPEHR
jgi:eukaryotic-like serine/threonine-protein kinase